MAMAKTIKKPATYLDFYAPDALVERNTFRDASPDRSGVPTFDQSRHLLPVPDWDGHDAAVACYWKVWDLAFRNLKPARQENGFVSPYIDTAFNNCLFMWDSAFILMFARYGRRAFEFQRTLDNIYAKQHPDGFISREIHESDGQDQFHRHDPASTGPNVLAWCEWEYWLNYGDRDRLARVYPPLLAYHRWMRRHRSWPDGTYWTCGLGCGMDNQPRTTAGYECHLDHGHMSWIDATAQAVLSANVIARMADALGCGGEVGDLRAEARTLDRVINATMWDERAQFYGDRLRDGAINPVKSVGAYWTLLADLVPPQRLPSFVEHLQDKAEFNRPHRIPSLSATHPAYRADGGYWLGSVWPSTNYMVLRGLTRHGYDDLAHVIGRNHLDNVVAVFERTGTVWENYAPEIVAAGNPAKGDFVGWGGLGPVAVLFEHVMGLRPDVPSNTLIWDVRLTEAHGVRQYPFGTQGLLDVRVAARAHERDRPVIDVTSNCDLQIALRWPGGQETLDVRAA
jgi:hypothetical protein